MRSSYDQHSAMTLRAYHEAKPANVRRTAKRHAPKRAGGAFVLRLLPLIPAAVFVAALVH